MTPSVPVILNPIAGGGRLLREQGRLQAVAADLGFELDIWISESPGHTVELAARAAADERPLVLAYGGDGTYNSVARGLLGSSTTMGVLPGGTTSVLAYEFGVPRPAQRAIRSLLEGEDRAMRVGRTDDDEIVLLMLSAGPDSHVLERLRPSFKRLGGRVGVALQAVVEAVNGIPLPRIRVESTSGVDEAGWVIIGNSRCYGGKFCATPGADPFRDDFEVVVQRGNGRRAAVSFLFGIPSGRHIRRDDVVRKVINRVRLEPAIEGHAIPYQIDGDVVGKLPVEISVDPKPLWVRLPEQG
jgi:diacylglycerol kinase family enzyme